MDTGLTSAQQEDRCVCVCVCVCVCCEITLSSPRVLRYGPNSLDVPVKPYHVLLIEEVLHPFYIFEILTVMFWMIDDYYYYAG